MLDSNFSDYFVFAINFRLFVFLVCLGITEVRTTSIFCLGSHKPVNQVNCRLLSRIFTLINPVSFSSFIFFQTHCFQLLANVPGGPWLPLLPTSPLVPCDPLGPGSPSLPGFPASPLSPRGPVDPCEPSEPAMPAGPEGPGFPGIPGIPGAQKQAP